MFDKNKDNTKNYLSYTVMFAWFLSQTCGKLDADYVTYKSERHHEHGIIKSSTFDASSEHKQKSHRLNVFSQKHDSEAGFDNSTVDCVECYYVRYKSERHHEHEYDSEVGFDNSSTGKYVACPSNGNTVELDAGTYSFQFANTRSLCTLTKREEDNNFGIARSYDGNSWEISAGEFASSFFDSSISCGDNTCTVVLPILHATAKYHLTSYDHSISERDELARFLESATFGITQSEILDLQNISSGTPAQKISKWIENQMEIPYTSHRELWREGVNPRLPYPMPWGIQDHPCTAESRWRKFSFVKNDSHDLLPGLKIQGSGPYILSLEDHPRTTVQNLQIENNDYADYIFDPDFEYIICDVVPKIGDTLEIKLEDGSCQNIGNPVVDFTTNENLPTYIINLAGGDLQPIDEEWTEGQELILKNDLQDVSCNNIPTLMDIGDPPIYGQLADGTWLQFDPRLNLRTNTIADPHLDGGYNEVILGGTTLCMNTPRNFLNENSCFLSPVDACGYTSTALDIELTIDEATIIKFYELSGRYVYGLKGLPVLDIDNTMIQHPCTQKVRSRWELKETSSCSPTELSSQTKLTLTQLIQEASDQNSMIRDIFFPKEGLSCDPIDTDANIELLIDDECWTHVHPDHMSIFDMTYWTLPNNHPGGINKITKWAENGQGFLTFPAYSHPIERWNMNYKRFPYVGKVGDKIFIRDLPSDIKTDELLKYYGDENETKTSGVLVCGSLGEVGNKKETGFLFDIFDNHIETYQPYHISNNREYVWIMIVLNASDQLRQRVAWAMAQIIVVATSSIRNEKASELFLNYYDIFVRNSFGNYRDILKEISYSPVMAENLSYLGSRSYAYMWERFQIKAFADENFAREIMQLFTIGTVKLHVDGTTMLDTENDPILTYTNDDIMSFSRAWTGFSRPLKRGNIENNNFIDPMGIEATWRDRFPKTDLQGGYIGDYLPLCVDLPSKAFLQIGATYRLLGSTNLPQLIKDDARFASDDTIKKFVLSPTSNLKVKLCNQGPNGECRYQNSVTLESPVLCTGNECNVDTVRVVQVADLVFYEYVQSPCVQQVFYGDAKTVSDRKSANGLCANPLLPVAAEACCQTGKDKAERNVVYDGERMTFISAISRCEDVSKEACNFSKVKGDEVYKLSSYFWTIDDCSIQIKVNKDGYASIVHKPTFYTKKVSHIDDSNENWFKIYWNDDVFPVTSMGCNGVCEVVNNSCLCNTAVNTSPVFDEMPQSIDEITSKLYIGALHPSTYETNSYSVRVEPSAGISAYLKDGQINIHTIFEFTDDKGRTRFLKNVRETVDVVDSNGGSTGYSFRNVPQFMSLIPSEETVRDAQYETDEVLDSYFYHDNMAPFIAVRLIQRLVLSNPSPRYIQIVATAFISGKYLSFGTGAYGDLCSTVAAIFLDREARNVLLDDDISNGMLREPILKVTALLRSMNFVPKQRVPQITYLQREIGQMAHNFESVFSFFLPEFKPYGRIGGSSLVSPEAMLLDTPKIIGLLNGITSFVKFGLSNCDGGFAPKLLPNLKCNRDDEAFKLSHGFLELYQTTTPETEFIAETFEGPSLTGGFDNFWTGHNFRDYSGRVVPDPDPTSSGNHVLNFSELSGLDMIGAPFTKDANIDSYVVKFRYFSPNGIDGGGCIGYSNSDGENEVWSLCDYRKGDNLMSSSGEWITCQFEIPPGLSTFRVVLKDSKSGKNDKIPGDAYFDDIQIAPGSGTICDDVQLQDVDPPGQLGYSDLVINELATLLTAGRLDDTSRQIIRDAYDNSGSADEGLHVAQQLILTTSEFHSTDLTRQTHEKRKEFVFPAPTNKTYKAVVMMMFNGGCDSFNLLVPYSCTKGTDLRSQYTDVRQGIALARDQTKPITVSNQICEKFGIHEALPILNRLYDDDDLIFLANTGVLTKPVNKNNYKAVTKTRIFAHNSMREETKRVDPLYRSPLTGVLGRMSDILSRHGHNVGSFAIDGFSVALAGMPGVREQPMVVSRKDITQFHVSDAIRSAINKLHNETKSDNGLFAETWSSAFMNSIGINEKLINVLPDDTETQFSDTKLGDRLKTVSKLISTRNERGVDRDIFFVELAGFDTHDDVTERLNTLFQEVNDAISAFSDELKAMEIWDSVTTIEVSDFARTLSPNGGNGTDHGWGGNYMMFGGAVKGGQMLGTYPNDLTDEGTQSVGRGRLIPSTPWDSCFRGIAEWFGVDISEMDEACPNCVNFPTSELFRGNDMFVDVPSIPTATPTAPPTKGDSPNPTTPPPTIQTMSPTMSPTPLPSTSPTVSPTLIHNTCISPGSSCYRTHAWGGCDNPTCEKKVCDKRKKCCTKRFKKICVKKAQTLCTACECSEKKSTKFVRKVKVVQGEEIPLLKSCKWLSKKVNDQERIELCKLYDSLFDGYDRIRSACPITCNACKVSQCTPPSSNCYTQHAWSGCDDSTCETKVCDSRAKCCTKRFNNSCVKKANELCESC